jgi:hypothetical protein
MQYREYTTRDKSSWQRGEWDDEPDKVQFQDEVTGLPCLIVRGPSGALCGYVGVADGHPMYKVSYDEARGADGEWIEVHGGLTFSDSCQPSSDESHGICHLPDDGEPDHVWWFGFDCAHSGDVTPEPRRFYSAFGDEVYRNRAYVEREIRGLAAQLAAFSRPSTT